MSGFDLVPVDGGEPVHLPPGESVLGRGPLLGVSDKRVSRHHGLLENLRGQLRLKPTHVNPCFVQSSLTDDPRPLKKDSWYPLHHGVFISLLPGQFIYKVVAVGGGESSSSQILEEEKEELPGSPEPDVEPAHPMRRERGQTPPHEGPSLASPTNEEDEDSPNGLDQGHSAVAQEVEDGRSDAAPAVERKRVLPAWMMAAAAASSTVQSAAKRSKAAAAASAGTKRAAKQAPPTTTSLPEEAELSEQEEEEKRPRKRRRKISDEEEERAASKTDVPSEEPRPQTGSSRSEVSDESDGVTMEVEEEGERGETSTADRNTATPTSDISESVRDDDKSTNGEQTTKRAESVGSRPRLRTPCLYGKDCYRKNPVHFQECSHPGDTDYEEEEEEEEEEADRPECPYGTDCYRKNPLHKKEYKHTQRPARASRTLPRKTPAEDEDDGDDDDSFINDDSEDAGDDSDYAPPDSDDSGEEDIRRLQREAKVFLKKRT